MGLKYEEFENRANNNFLLGSGFETCINPKCKEKFIFEPGKVDLNTRDEKGQKISSQSAEHFAKNRCRCPKCETEFCIGCKNSPFHTGS